MSTGKYTCKNACIRVSTCSLEPKIMGPSIAHAYMYARVRAFSSCNAAACIYVCNTYRNIRMYDVYACMYVYHSIRMYVCSMYACMYVRLYVRLYAYACMYVYMYVYLSVCMYAVCFIQIDSRVCTDTCVRTCLPCKRARDLYQITVYISIRSLRTRHQT